MKNSLLYVFLRKIFLCRELVTKSATRFTVDYTDRQFYLKTYDFPAKLRFWGKNLIIRRYILKEVSLTLLAVTVILFLIYLSNRFIRFLADAAAGNLPAEMLAILLALKGVGSLVMLLPLALYLAILITMGRLYKDHEIIALMASGVGEAQLLKYISVLALIGAGVVAALSLYISPWAYRQSAVIEARASAAAEFTGIGSGRFKEFTSSGLIFYAEKISDDRKTMENVFIYSERDSRINILSAQSAYQKIDPATGERFLVLRDGHRYEALPGAADVNIMGYQEHGVRIVEHGTHTAGSPLSSRTTKELMQAPDAESKAELQWRFAAPASAFLLALLAVPISRANPREGRYAKLLAAILVYLVYSNLMAVAQAWYAQGLVPPALGLWWVHGLLLLLILVLLFKQPGRTLLFRRRQGNSNPTTKNPPA